MSDSPKIANNNAQVVLYTTADGNTRLEVKLDKETAWLTQSQMAELFGRDRSLSPAISEIYSRKANWTKAWYVQKMHNPRTTVEG